MKKRLFSIVMLLILILSFSACGTSSGNVKITLPGVGAEREAAEKAGAFAVKHYLYARLKTEALIEYDLANGSADELSAMIDEALEVWSVAEAAAIGAERVASVGDKIAAFEAAPVSCISDEKSFSPFLTAYAAEENAATRWAKEITEKFDSYPANQRIKGLAQDLGVDAKSAYKQLQMAQDILKGDAEREEGDLNALVENSLLATRTACKTGLYIGGIAASGGVLTGGAEVGGFLIGGADVIVDIAATGSTIILGEDHMVTRAFNKEKDLLAPVSAVAGIFTFDTGNVADKLSYIGDSLLDLCQEKKILGGIYKFGDEDKPATMTVVEIDIADKSPEEVKKELKKTGLPVPPEKEAVRTAAEAAEELKENMGGELTKEAVEKYFNDLIKQMEQESAAEEKTENAPVSGNKPESSNGVVKTAGNYTMSTTKEDGLTDSFSAEVTLHNDGKMEIAFTPHAVVVNDDFTFSVNPNAFGPSEHLVGRYDSNTNIFTGMGDTGNADDAWNWAATVLTFDPKTGNASGVMGSDLEGLAAAAFKTQITLVKEQ